MVSRLLGVWVVWRIARKAVPLLIAIALLGLLAASIHRPSPVTTPRVLAPVTRSIAHDLVPLINGAQHAITRALQP